MADALADLVRRLLSEPDHVNELTKRIAARTESPESIAMLVAYARSRQVSAGQAKVRRILTDAGVSWEAL
jgi:hypothetical protein